MCSQKLDYTVSQINDQSSVLLEDDDVTFRRFDKWLTERMRNGLSISKK